MHHVQRPELTAHAGAGQLELGVSEVLNATLVYQAPIVLTKYREATCFRIHRGKVHVVFTDWFNEIQPIQALEQSKLSVILRIGSYAVIWGGRLRLETGIQRKLFARVLEEVGDLAKIIERDWWLDLSDRAKSLYVRFKYGALFPSGQRLIDVCVDAAWRDIAHQVSGATIESVHE